MAVVALGESDLAAPGLLYYLFAYLAMNVGAFGRRHRASRPRRDRALTGLARAQPWLVAAMLLFLSRRVRRSELRIRVSARVNPHTIGPVTSCASEPF